MNKEPKPQLTGKIPGTRLTVVKFSHYINCKRYNVYQCDCGNRHTARHDNVLAGNVTSCGCKWKEMMHAHMQKMRDSPKRLEGIMKAAAEGKMSTAQGKIRIEQPPGSKKYRFVTEKELTELYYSI